VYGFGCLILINKLELRGGSSDFKYPLTLSEDRSKLCMNSVDILNAWSDSISKLKNSITYSHNVNVKNNLNTSHFQSMILNLSKVNKEENEILNKKLRELQLLKGEK